MPEPELGSELHIEVHGDWGEATEDYLEGCGLLAKVWREDPDILSLVSACTRSSRSP